MKSFFFGVLLTFSCFMIYQNHVLSQKLAKMKNLNQIQKIVIKKNKHKRVQPQEDDVAYWEKKDPRCPSLLPYYAGHWGCVVKPVSPY
jgi:hypothetical protein